MTDKIPLTVQGFDMLQGELKNRTSVERGRIVNAIAEARAHGDLSENAEYKAAREEQGFNEGRIAELEGLLSRAEVIDPKKLKGDAVKFGATVKLIDDDTEEEKTYIIVGEAEADVKKGRLSVASPIAHALLGKKQGDVAEVRTPGGLKTYEIAQISYV